MTIGLRIKARRKELRMSRAVLASKIQISVTALQKIEEGKTKVPRNLGFIASVLEVNPIWLQFGTNDPNSGSLLLSKDETGLLSRFRQLNQDEKDFIVKCITGLLSETYK